jgi:sugar phosphate isomerase/epimerase
MMNKIGYRIDDERIDGSMVRLDQELESLKAAGINCVELPVHGLDVIKNGELDEKALKKAGAVLGSYEFDYTVHCVDSMNLMDEENARGQLKLFRSSLEFCARIGAEVFVYHPGRFMPEEEFIFNRKNEMDEKETDYLMEKERVYIKNEAARFPGINICMENARPYKAVRNYCYAEQMDLLTGQVRAIDCANVGMTLDTGHLNLSANYYKFNLLQAVEAAKKYIFHVHLHDNFGKVCYYHEKKQAHLIPLGKGDCHMPMGMGAAPIKNIIDSLKNDYKGRFIFEYRSRYRDLLQGSVENLNAILDGKDLILEKK